MRVEGRASAVQLLRYGLVGITTNLFGYLLFCLITYVGVKPKIAMTVLYITGATIGFLGHRNWTFSHTGNWRLASTRYIVAHCLGYLINLLLLYGLVDRLGYSYRLAQAAAICIVAGFLFLVFKLFVFPKSKC